jgi:two-component system, LytTR family, response regulator
MIKTVIVDDEPIIFDMLKDLLNKLDDDFKVVGTAESKQNAISLIQKTKPDVVFVDINMPRGSGLELLDFFPTRTFQVVFITGYTVLEPFTKKYKHTGFLTKPVDEEDLKQIINLIKQNIDDGGEHIRRNENIL